MSQVAVDVRRQLADKDSNTLPDLASSLHSLAGYQYAEDRDDDAVRNITEAVQIRKFLCGYNRQHLPDLAQSLSDQADYMYSTSCESSIKAIQESIHIRQVLAGNDPKKLTNLVNSYEVSPAIKKS